MNQVVLAALAAAVAAWLILPPSSSALSRLRPARQAAGRRGGPEPMLGLASRMLAGIGTGAMALLVLPGAAGILVAGVAGPATAVVLGRLPRRTDVRILTIELPEALEFLAVCLDAGQPVGHAVTAVAKVSPEATRSLLERVAAQVALGRAGPSAWEDLRGHSVWGRVAADIARAERSGTGLADVLRMHAEDGRRDARDLAVKEARKVGVRSVVPLMACFLPAFILVGVVPIVAGLLRDFFG
ncbi:type II secretion system F family protein [Tessaracoccus flavescens]|uniref:Type II secretion system protein GspF domain-containing protein n=1 Tax=Tessaracoccus flavescens TaxID=399497 RepID=A0A1Q2CVZ4_9ACTN|nr:type II secretion system F family protein [Tessaracoccus flavescens]AQP50277.1 hypothetical protein BW733_04935 [Tessaracoccus flavescens]